MELTNPAESSGHRSAGYLVRLALPESAFDSLEAALPPHVRYKAGLCPRFALCPHFQRPEAEPGAQPIIPEIADGAAQPRLTSGGRAEVDRSN